MDEVLLAKEEGLRIAISILSGKKTNKDYGGTALRETELILINILETLQVEKEMLAKSPSKPKKPNKKEAAVSKDLRAAKNLMTDWKNLTILELEKESQL